ncbi:tRNA (guanosine(46)-N7)-methyltransferase TrmB [Dinghuibacter silviterrae]|uniref:tRNA (guanine(46)-N(7))-methyltransferase n=1 Tax=Dinghuibacter silviterrae TaxID=1539049 RepID=A0A4R8DPH6_9BACT|nr:tRNA (guanosine(46)-N7)-methyltransferase TrmB [Dinghuibacter silviterrae]TDW99635.1 tRNA (guanine-N(7)-)-methyltransferase [Dinghuibacter silviterrae]
MGYKKLIRFAAIKEFPHVLEYPQGMPGRWADFFHNTHPLTLELACGKGEYTIGLARLYPEGNFIGVDIKGNRIWVGASKALADNLANVAFLRSQIELLPTYFAPGEVKDIWITFPDPQLQLSRAKKRLTHPRFLRQYREFLRPDGQVHLKTDSPDLYAFTQTVIGLYDLPLYESSDNIYARAEVSPELSIRTHYEGLDIAGSKRVHYLRFGLRETLLDEQRAEALKELLQHAVD